eukprot:scaffold141662_cov30-Prasinocladus_malaysianus.AAC.1
MLADVRSPALLATVPPFRFSCFANVEVHMASYCCHSPFLRVFPGSSVILSLPRVRFMSDCESNVRDR